MAKPKKASDSTAGKNEINLPGDPNKIRKKQIAELAYGPEFRALVGGDPFNKSIFPDLDVNDILTTLKESVSEVKAGKMDKVEATLIMQANTLDLVFNSLLQRAAAQEFLNQYEAFMRLALKAQSQCRTTLETLAEIKNPKPTAFIKQQNMAAVQQVNNNTLAHAQGNENMPSELSERREHVEVLEQGAAKPAIETHSRMEALGEVYRPQESGRQKEVVEERGQWRE